MLFLIFTDDVSRGVDIVDQFLIVFLAKYLFFNWSYSTTSFEFINIFFFISKKIGDTSFLDFKM